MNLQALVVFTMETVPYLESVTGVPWEAKIEPQIRQPHTSAAAQKGNKNVAPQHFLVPFLIRI